MIKSIGAWFRSKPAAPEPTPEQPPRLVVQKMVKLIEASGADWEPTGTVFGLRMLHKNPDFTVALYPDFGGGRVYTTPEIELTPAEASLLMGCYSRWELRRLAAFEEDRAARIRAIEEANV